MLFVASANLFGCDARTGGAAHQSPRKISDASRKISVFSVTYKSTERNFIRS
jgi:hypothetical protein